MKLFSLVMCIVIVVGLSSLVLGLYPRKLLGDQGDRGYQGYEGYEARGPIPKQIWQTYKTADIPKKAVECQRTWTRHTPEYQYQFLDDEGILAFMKKHFDRRTVATFESFPVGVMKADMWRYCALYVQGGIYSDIDSIALQSVSEWKIKPEDQMIIGLENDTHFCQWTIAAVPRHPLLRKLIDTIVEEARKGIDVANEHFVHFHTGPGIWTRVIHEFMGYPKEQRARHTYKLYVSDATHREKFKHYGIRLEDRPFFSSVMVKNLYGSTQFQDGYHSWMDERDRLRQKHQRNSPTPINSPTPSPKSPK